MNDRIRELLLQYDQDLSRFAPNRIEDVPDDGGPILGHARWMIQTMLDEGDEWTEAKVVVWFGFIQGTMVSMGVAGIKKLRLQSEHLF